MFLECKKCSLHKKGRAVAGEGPHPADIMVVGINPGPKEIEQERILVGPTGRKIEQALSLASLAREDLYMTNIVKCYTPVKSSRKLSKTHIGICMKEHLLQEIKEVKPKVIIVLGRAATGFIDAKFIPDSHYYSTKYECYIVITHHPRQLFGTVEDKIHDEFKHAFIIAKSLVGEKEEETINVTTYVEEVTSEILAPFKEEVSVDLETTGIEWMTDSILAVGISDGTTTIGVPISVSEENNMNKLALSSIVKKNRKILWKWLLTKKIIGQNFKFDYKLFKRDGLDLDVYFDTMLAHFLIDREAPHSLEAMSIKYLHTKFSKGTIDFDAKGPIDIKERAIYGGNDAYETYKLYELFKPEIDKNYSKVFYQILMPSLVWLANAELKGVKVDREYVQTHLNSFKYQLIATEKDIKNDPDVAAYCKEEGIQDFNLKSHKQLKGLIYGFLHMKSKMGNTAEGTLEYLSSKYPQYDFLKKIVLYRHLYKMYRTYFQNLLKFSEFDGRVHCEYNQARVPTGRLASSNPNLQNIPEHGDLAKEVKRSFVAEEGYTLIKADYGQAEFRALANYSKDPTMIRWINEGKDVHKIIASVSYMIPEDQVTKEQREASKTITYGIMYGRGSKSIAEMLGIPIEEAEKIRSTFFETFKTAAAWIKKVQSFAKMNGYIKTITGRKITLPQVYSKDKEKVAYALRCAVNYPVQGAAGDMTNLAGALVYKHLKEHKVPAYLIMNIHDALVVECKDKRVKEMKEVVKSIMEDSVKDVMEMKVKLVVDIETGKDLAMEQ